MRCSRDVLAVLLLLSTITARSAPAEGELRGEIPTEIVVIGSKQKIDQLTGAGVYVSSEDILRQGYDDINRVLRKAPGVNVREEDGFGLFPNISLRGVDTQRTSKITVMEDGIPTAPATYSAPAAYYTPTTGRMAGIEVLKGSSQIRFGPHTTGGVMNYRSTPIPEGMHGRLGVSFGSDADFRQHAYVGNSWSTELGEFGFVAEHYFRHADGYKSIDATASSGGSDDTGFRKSEPMFKFFWEPRTVRFQRIEAKIGLTDLDADETYLGLIDADFEADSVRRYSASRFDNIDTNHLRSYLRHTIELTPNLSATTTGYYNRFDRNWFKLRGDGEDLAVNTSNGCWTGQAACDLKYRNNRRGYYSAGVESILDWTTSVGASDHELKLGLRYHQDRVERDQDNFTWVQRDDGSMDYAASRSEGPCTGGCRWQQSRGLALFVQDRIDWGNWTVQPGLRFERIEYSFTETPAATLVETSEDRDVLTYWAPGIGLRYQLTPDLSLFGGLHRGVSVPGPRSNVKSGIREETSLGAELGARWAPSRWLNTEVVLFHTKFDDLLVTDNIGSGGGSGRDENVGSVNSYGLELALEFDPGLWRDWSFQNPWHVSVTLTSATLDGDTTSTDPESIFAGGRDGDDVPYIPDYQVSVGSGIEFDRLGIFIDASWVDRTFSTASNEASPINPFTGAVDYSFGDTDSFFVVDLSARYDLNEQISISVNVHNLLDEEYIVSRHPIGPRPGRPRSLHVGVSYDF
jgi:Fe(3+) dicitrate transport protein